MIAFGSAISDPVAYRAYARPGIELAAEADSEIYAFASVGSLARTYNLLLETASLREDLEALVIVHPHLRILGADLCARIREAFAEPDVGVLGCAGATGAGGIAWWDGEVRAAEVELRYEEHGGGEMPAFSWTTIAPAPGPVETVDGFLMVISPWAVRNVRFDESLALGHGYDLDFCLQVRAAGRRSAVIDVPARRHQSLELFSDAEVWVEKHIQVAEKWEGQWPGREAEELDWAERARWAEAEREAARAITYGRLLTYDARVLGLERAVREAETSLSWRVTEPLRRLNLWRTQRRERRARP